MTSMDDIDQPLQVAKITVLLELADGSQVEAEAPVPHDVTVDVHHPEVDYDLSDPNRLIAYLPPAAITLRFTADRYRGYRETIRSRAEVEDIAAKAAESAETQAAIAASLAAIAARLDGIAPRA
jgi:hypothetical protein